MDLKENWRAWHSNLGGEYRLALSSEGEEALRNCYMQRRTYVKSPVASLCLICSSVKKRVSVTISVLIFSEPTGPLPLVPLVVMMNRSEEGIECLRLEVPR